MEFLEDPCSDHDKQLAEYEMAFGTFGDADERTRSLARLVRGLVTVLRSHERARVERIIRQI